VDSGPSGCFGTPTAAVATTCEGFALGMECSPISGCRESGSCFPTQTMTDCQVRPINSCGFGPGTNNCHILEGDNPPSTFTCVQTERAGQCDNGEQVDKGACLTFDGSANTEGGVCLWDSGDTPSCVAMECAGYPIAQFCNAIEGCSWNN